MTSPTRKILSEKSAGHGGGDGNEAGAFESATTTVNGYDVGTVVLDLFDAATKGALSWRTPTKTLSGNPDRNAENLNKAIAKMFREYPLSTRSRAN